jgi:hypothetical protein
MTARAVRAGNTNALRHGIAVETDVRADVLDEATLIFARAPWLDPVRDGILVEATARLVVRLRRLDGALEDADVAPSVAGFFSRLEAQLLRNLDALGLTPAAATRLGIARLDAREKAQRLVETELSKYRTGLARTREEAGR